MIFLFFNFYLIASPVSVSARGHKCLGGNLGGFGFRHPRLPDNIMSIFMSVGWTPKSAPDYGGRSQKMVSWDDLDSEGPIKLYDKHVEKTSVSYETYGEFQLLFPGGSITFLK